LSGKVSGIVEVHFWIKRILTLFYTPCDWIAMKTDRAKHYFGKKIVLCLLFLTLLKSSAKSDEKILLQNIANLP
jgi:hypothetical protein